MAKKTVEEKVETTTEKTAAKPAFNATVYIGDSLPGLNRYTVFVGGKLPEHAKQMIAKNKNIAGLIVPVSELQTSRQNVNKKGHRLNAFAENLKVKKEK